MPLKKLSSLPFDRIAGALLCISAVLKSRQYVTTPQSLDLVFGSAILSLVVIVVEWIVGLLILFNMSRSVTRVLICVTYGSFAIYSIYRLFMPYTSCGCFGPLRVHPLIVVLLDLSIIYGTLLQSDFSHVGKASWYKIVMCFSLAFWPSLYAILDTEDVRATKVLDLNLLLKPGIKADFFGLIDIGHDFETGYWKIIFFRKSCHYCIEAIPSYETSARRATILKSEPKVAMVEIPPLSPDNNASLYDHSLITTGHFSDSFLWKARTPTSLIVRNGVIEQIR